MNCPKCGSGILEPMMILGFKDRKVTCQPYDDEKPEAGELTLSVCSLDECGYVEMVAAPRTLASAKKAMQKQRFLRSKSSCRF